MAITVPDTLRRPIKSAKLNALSTFVELELFGGSIFADGNG